MMQQVNKAMNIYRSQEPQVYLFTERTEHEAEAEAVARADGRL